MAETEWDPLKELLRVQQQMNKLFESALARTNFDADGGFGAWSPVSDLYETSDRVVLSVELPGLALADIDVRVEGDDLVVTGERRMDREPSGEFHRVERSYGKFMRRFPLPPAADRDSVKAVYRDGVLQATLTKKGHEKGKAIRVAVS